VDETQPSPLVVPAPLALPAEAWVRVAPGVVLVDPAGRVISLSLAGQTLLSCEAEQVLGVPLAALFAPAETGRVAQLLREATHDATAPQVLIGRDSRRLVVSAQPLPTSSGSLVVLLAESPHAGDGGEAQGLRLRDHADRFLSQATALLSSFFDYRATLSTLARIALPHFADWCIVDMVITGLPPIQRLIVAHRDPAKTHLAARLSRHTPDPTAAAGVGKVLRTGQPDLFPDISPDQVAAATSGAEHAQLVYALGCRSLMCVPLRARGRSLGALTFVLGDSGRSYSAEDLLLAELAEEAGEGSDVDISADELDELIRADA